MIGQVLPIPKVSIIIPTYKHRDFVLATLDSVFAQTFTDYEVIVVNDGSPDDTAEVLRPLAEAGRIRYIEQANAGQAAARNRGIAEAQGEFIALLDDDDLWPPEKLERQVEVLRSDANAILAYGSSTGFEDGGCSHPGPDAPSGLVESEFLERNWITSPGQTLIRKEALDRIGGFDPQLWGVDDWDLYIRLTPLGKFLYDSKPALYYRMHATNASKDVWRMYVQACRLVEKHRDKFRDHDHNLRWMYDRNVKPYYAHQCLLLAIERKSKSDGQGVRRMLWMAARIQPATLRRRLFVNTLIASFMAVQNK